MEGAETAGRRRFARAKFVVPPVPDRIVARARLGDALERGTQLPLTMVVGPPGSGKTIAVASWLTSRAERQSAAPGRRAMWMSCDAGDADPVTFWEGVTECVRRNSPHLCLEARDLLDEERPPFDDVAASIANELDEPATIVIDDFHVAHESTASVATFIDSVPAGVQLLLISRADPALALHRMRLRHQLLEVREDDLRLSLDETRSMTEALGLLLDEDAASLLQERTNGWMAAVHLAAISLRGREDPHTFLREFSGENRLVAEFLLEEVLSQQPPRIQRFLEESSVLDELDVAACQAVTGVSDSATLIRDLAVENTLIMPLGDGLTFKYHQLFRDLLQYRLRASSLERFAALHETAAKWYEDRREYDRAAAHLTAAGNHPAAYAVVRDHALDMLIAGGPAALEHVVTVLDLRRAADEPSRAVDVALALAIAGASDEATRWFRRLDDVTLDVADSSRLASGRALVHFHRGELPACEAALSHATASVRSDPVLAGLPPITVLARLFQDDTAGARAAHDAAEQAGSASLEVAEVMLTSALAWTAVVEGNLREANRLADETLDRAAHYGAVGHPMTCGALLARGRVLYECARFEPAEHCYDRMVLLSERCRSSFELLGLVSLARLWIAEGRLVEAAGSLERARSLPINATSPLLDLTKGCSVHLALATGDSARATALTSAMRPSPRRTRLEALIALANGDAGAALEGLDALQPETFRQRLDVAVLRARALHAHHADNSDEALRVAVRLAREEGAVIALTDDMPELSARVSFVLRSRPMDAFDQTVLDRLDRPRVTQADVELADRTGGLTAREQTILRYLDSRLSIREIASECYVSTNTVKSQSQAVYRKLGVSSRREAVTEGRRLQLI